MGVGADPELSRNTLVGIGQWMHQLDRQVRSSEGLVAGERS